MSSVLLVLSLLMAFLAIRIIIQIAHQYRCPDDDELRDLFYGRLKSNSDKRRTIVSHLGHCQKCRDRLDDIRLGKDLEDHIVE